MSGGASRSPALVTQVAYFFRTSYTRAHHRLRNLRNADGVMRNPFQYGSVVGADAFCDRQRELSDLRRAMENGEKLFVYSERRFGKTSLVKLALRKLPKKRFVGAYVDLLPTDGETAFAMATTTPWDTVD